MKAIVLLSGGIDSTVVLAMAKAAKKMCVALSFDYGQRHRIELKHAKKIAEHYQTAHQIIKIPSSCFEGSALVGHGHVPKNRTPKKIEEGGIPPTYVPARNTLFLAFALAQAEIHNAQEIHCGPNLLDQKPYPDCRPEFYAAFQQLALLATKQAAEGDPPIIATPLINWDKKRITKEARTLNAPLHLTFSCYSPENNKACQRCDACILRKEFQN